jgi:hypothetical protein
LNCAPYTQTPTHAHTNTLLTRMHPHTTFHSFVQYLIDVINLGVDHYYVMHWPMATRCFQRVLYLTALPSSAFSEATEATARRTTSPEGSSGSVSVTDLRRSAHDYLRHLQQSTQIYQSMIVCFPLSCVHFITFNVA